MLSEFVDLNRLVLVSLLKNWRNVGGGGSVVSEEVEDETVEGWRGT